MPDQGAILAIVKQQLATYELDDDIRDQKLRDLATEIASKRTLSGYDVTRALDVDLSRLLEKLWDTATHF